MKTLRMRDGRAMSWTEYGDPDGWPVLYCHGAPGCGAEIQLVFRGAEAARRAGVRLIAPDRPGMGGSTFQRDRRVLDWVNDVGALAEHLGIGTFSVLGYSAGTGYAVAVADCLSDRVSAAAILAAVAPVRPGVDDIGLDRAGQRMKSLARHHPLLARLALTLMMRLPARLAPQALLAEMTRGLPPVDSAILAAPAIRDGFVKTLRHAFGAGARGPQRDLALLTDWRAAPGGNIERAHIWQGTRDTTGASPAMAEWLHSAVPGSHLHLTDDGHLSIAVSCLDEALRAITPPFADDGRTRHLASRTR